MSRKKFGGGGGVGEGGGEGGGNVEGEGEGEQHGREEGYFDHEGSYILYRDVGWWDKGDTYFFHDPYDKAESAAHHAGAGPSPLSSPPPPPPPLGAASPHRSPHPSKKGVTDCGFAMTSEHPHWHHHASVASAEEVTHPYYSRRLSTPGAGVCGHWPYPRIPPHLIRALARARPLTAAPSHAWRTG